MKMIKMHVFLCVALLTPACMLPGDELAPLKDELTASSLDISAEESESAEEVLVEDSQVLALPPRLRAHKMIPYGGTIFEEDHYRNVGRACSPGYVRVEPPTVSWSGHGHCNFDGWVNSKNPRDCTARIHLHHSAGWLRGECSIDIFEERSPAHCGREGEFCGGTGSDGTCQCDRSCETYGDCCFDYYELCR